jgi:hypothetical protein
VLNTEAAPLSDLDPNGSVVYSIVLELHRSTLPMRFVRMILDGLGCTDVQ